MFVKGQPKPSGSGRKSGQPNKRTLLKTSVLLAEKDFHPVDEIIKLLPGLSPRDQANVLLELLQYLEPKKKEAAVEELSEDDSEEMSGTETVELLKMVKSKS